LIYDQALIGDGKTTSCLIGDHLTMLIGDQADWSLIGGGKIGPKCSLPEWGMEVKSESMILLTAMVTDMPSVF